MADVPKPAIERVLVSVDFGDPSLVAARWTAEHFAPGAEIILAHIIEPPPATRSNVMRFPSVETIVTKVHVDAERRLRELCESLLPARARAEIRVGVPYDELVALAITTRADIIVVGRQDLTSSGWARIGATAQRILRKSTVPVLLVAAPADHPPEHVLVAIDESSSTDDVLRWGSFVAHRFSARATVVHAASADDPPEEDTWITKEIGKISGSAAMDQRITRGAVRPADSIIEEARSLETELIVIGSRGAGAAHQMLFGSVAESVLLASPCPVLVVLPAG